MSTQKRKPNEGRQWGAEGVPVRVLMRVRTENTVGTNKNHQRARVMELIKAGKPATVACAQVTLIGK